MAGSQRTRLPENISSPKAGSEKKAIPLMSGDQDTMSAATFEQFFRPCVRVLFDWASFLIERWPVRLSVVEDRHALAEFRIPWNFAASGQVVKYDHPEATPAMLGSMPGRLTVLEACRRESILRIASAFAAERPPVILLVPTYHLPDNGHLVLDGTHRLTALVVSGVPCKVLTATVHGPLDRSVIPELRHWEPR